MIKKAIHNLYSYILWAFHYWIPMGLSWLFKCRTFCVVYALALVTVLPPLLTKNPKLNLIIEAVIMDLQEEYKIKNVSALLAEWLVNNYAEWIAVALLLWLVLHLLWADRRRKFFEALKHAGVRIVRGRGDHLGLLERIRNQGGVGMGVGTTGKLIKSYLQRREEKNIRRSFRKRKLTCTQRSFLIAANPSAGKTRTALELITALQPPIVIIWPASQVEPSLLIGLPKLICKMAVLADDIFITLQSGKPALPPGLDQIIRDCSNAWLFATKRLADFGEELPDVQRVNLETITEDELAGLAQEISKVEGVSPQQVISRYNGHPGGLIAASKAMRDRFEVLDNLAKMILWAEKTLFQLGVRSMTIARLRCVIKGVWGHENTDREFDTSLKTISRQGFAAYQEGELLVYPGYRDDAIKLPLLPQDLPGKTQKALKNCEDGKAFIEIGVSYANQYSPVYFEHPRRSLSAAIQAFQQALRFFTREAAPLDFAMTQTNLGTAYGRLATYAEPQENLALAVAAFEQALRFRTPVTAPLDYASTQHDLGTAYCSLAEYSDPQENLARAVAAFKRALRFYTPEATPLNYAMTQNNLGNAYNSLAAHTDPEENLASALAAFEQAFRFFTPEAAPLDYSGTQHNLGNAYRALAQLMDPEENLAYAIAAYLQALRFRTPEVAPLDYARTQTNLGVVYLRLAEHKAPEKNLFRAIAACRQTLRFFTPEATPLDYARTQHNLGIAYGALAELTDPQENLARAVAAYRQALRFFTPEVAPLDYARTQNDLGSAYHRLAAHTDPEENLAQAVAAYRQALRFRTPEATPLKYAMTQNNLGSAYGALAEYSDPQENLARAVAAFEQALRFYTPEATPLDYARTQNNLGSTYGALAAHADPQENLALAVAAFGRALRFRTPEVAPLKYAATQNNLGNAYGDLAAHTDPEENLALAVAAYQQALLIFSSILPEDHPSIERVKRNLSSIENR